MKILLYFIAQSSIFTSDILKCIKLEKIQLVYTTFYFIYT